MISDHSYLAFARATSKKGVYIIDAENAKQAEEADVLKKYGIKFGDFVFSILNNAETGFWTYLVICNNPNWQGNKGFVFTGVGGGLGLINHVLGLCLADTRYDPFYKPFAEFFDLFSNQVSNSGTIVSYLLQSFFNPYDNVANYSSIASFVGLNLGGIILALKIRQLEELKEKDINKFIAETNRLSKFLVSKEFKIISKIYDFLVNGLVGAGFAYYFLDFFAELGLNASRGVSLSTQIISALLYAFINALAEYEPQHERGIYKKLANGLRVIHLILLLGNSAYAFVGTAYMVSQIALDAWVVSHKDQNSVNNGFFYWTMVFSLLLVGANAAAHSYFKEKPNYVAKADDVEVAKEASSPITEENVAAATQPQNIKQGKQEAKSNYGTFWQDSPSNGKMEIIVASKGDEQEKQEIKPVIDEEHLSVQELDKYFEECYGRLSNMEP